MILKDILPKKGVLVALGSALLFGAGTPMAKILLNNVSPWLLAGLLYFGSGIGVMIYRLLKKSEKVSLTYKELLWFSGAILSGGIIAPLLLMLGLTGMPVSGASLLLNSEGVFTALLAWFVFKENFDGRIAFGMVFIAIGAVVLSWPGEANFSGALPAISILGSCFFWGIDNNLTRKVSLIDATQVASIKGLVAGIVNILLAFSIGASLPSFAIISASMLIGFFSYGVSLTLFVLALHNLGTARTGAYFSIAPFFGTLIALTMGDPFTLSLLISGIFMAIGILLHLTEKHSHEHIHPVIEHNHKHIHDEHHQHKHNNPVIEHSHLHKHEELKHEHDHFPDSHHRHTH